MAESEGGGGNVLTRKIGPLPAWAYGAAAAVLAYLYIRRQQGTSASTADTSSTDGTSSEDASTIAQDTADDLAADDTGGDGDADDFTTPPNTTNLPVPPSSPPPTKGKGGTPGPNGNTSGKLRVVTVAKGDDTLAAFMRKYGVSLAQIKKDNPGRQWRAGERLKVGEKIHVPAKG